MNNAVHKFLESTVGNVFGKDVTCREPIHRCDDYQPGVLTEFGRTGVRLFKKFLMPCGLCAAVPLAKADPPPQEPAKPCCHEKETGSSLIKPSELPIYSHEDDSCKRTWYSTSNFIATPTPLVLVTENFFETYDKDCKPSALEQQISKIRRSVQEVVMQYQHITTTVTDKIDTGVEHSRVLLDYLRDESNLMPRVGAIGIGGLTGLIFGLRGGKFKRLVYTTTGAATVGAICYPKHAEEGLNLAKHYANISYNFVYGVKPGDEKRLELKLPEWPHFKVPTSFSEFFDLAIDTGATAANAVGSLAVKAYKSVTDKKEESPPSEGSDSKKSD